MSQQDITIQPEIIKLFDERKRLRQALEESFSQTRSLEQYSSQVEVTAVTQQLAPLTGEATPPNELAAVLPLLERAVTEGRNTQARIREQYAAIEEIKRRARNLKYTLIGSGVAVFGILFLILLHAVGVF
ncbi:MAG: hypothetical protein ACJ8CB_35380 [Ktedonobacteraceae bacterium]